jgi:hypothetical protein
MAAAYADLQPPAQEERHRSFSHLLSEPIQPEAPVTKMRMKGLLGRVSAAHPLSSGGDTMDDLKLALGVDGEAQVDAAVGWVEPA